jgi:diguanylate cyclase (GGDEF)-like protein/PAS domain S-box-containing protein
VDQAGEAERLQRRLDREHRARAEAETIAERATRELYETIGDLQQSQAMLDATPDFVAIAGIDGRLTYLNHAFLVLLQHESGSLDELDLWTVLAPDHRAQFVEDVVPKLKSDGLWRGELAISRPGGSAIPVSQVLIAHRAGDGAVVSVSSISRDITERRELEAQLAHQALRDPLTALPNRLLLIDRLQQAITRATREHSLCAALFLDLDRFKLINDGLGHAAGDELLRLASRRISSVLRSGDTVGRLGGDEFLVICDGLAGEHDALAMAGRIDSALRQPCRVGGEEVFVSTSIGIAVAKGDDDPEELIRQADEAMYQAKHKGRGRYEVFRVGLREKATERLQMQGDLHRAIDSAQLRVHHQPIVELRSGRMIAVEALVRWEHPERGVLLPSEFTPLADDSGLMARIDRWVFGEACRQAAAWAEQCPALAALCVHVNLSPQNFTRPGLAAHVGATLAGCGVPAARIAFEISESTLMESDGPAMSELAALRELGCQVGTDGFGVGDSSLASLKRFPTDFIKIDRSFVAGVGEGRADSAITKALVTLGRGLGLRVFAVGVETPQQLASLTALGCELGQGFYFSPPVRAEAIGEAGEPWPRTA